MVPLIMGFIVSAVVAQDKIIKAISLYINDIFINKSVCSAFSIMTHLEWFRLPSKDPEQLQSGTAS